MPSKLVQIAHAARASMLLRIAHAARTAAAATSRFAERAALSPEALAVPSPAAAMDDASVASPTHYLKELCGRKNTVEFVVQEEGLKSDEALRALYERWRKAFNQKRDHDEMASRFSEFKDLQTKPSDLPFKLSRYADGN
ncbi:uncharacterized protein LOC106866154 [Brachypodium distachyon]|uniref:Cathepsin propeptide inhibitor domain-containing protein n=1 Tax=Brachypodium distachyon TaxID=15368 RepID=I1HBA2_BRADI|nr:uncharacterized protein LOC106866154 [Brachypodium distachyon]KQK02355.1 hypothetical protein BRADI_2g00970v3 [Brachypodium distachyon]|eukprot:XP_014754392.1 uncharacterized protein LOC106866154 [Brachypodium distachyon]